MNGRRRIRRLVIAGLLILLPGCAATPRLIGLDRNAVRASRIHACFLYYEA